MPVRIPPPLAGSTHAFIIPGGCPVVDEEIILADRISVSAGVRSTQIVLTPDDYLRMMGPLVGRYGG